MQDAVKSYGSLFIETFTSLFIKTALSIEDITNMLDGPLGQKKRFFKFIIFHLELKLTFVDWNSLHFIQIFFKMFKNTGQNYWFSVQEIYLLKYISLCKGCKQIIAICLKILFKKLCGKSQKRCSHQNKTKFDQQSWKILSSCLSPNFVIKPFATPGFLLSHQVYPLNNYRDVPRCKATRSQ